MEFKKKIRTHYSLVFCSVLIQILKFRELLNEKENVLGFDGKLAGGRRYSGGDVILLLRP